MNRPRTGPLPQRVVALAAVTSTSQTAPQSARDIADAVLLCARHRVPKTQLNRVFGQRKRNHLEDIETMLTWLLSNDAAVELVGFPQARRDWIDAARSMLAGETATTAFRLNKPGRPKILAFAAIHDAALLAEALRRFRDLSLAAAIEQAAGLTDDGKRSLDLDTKRIRSKCRHLRQISDHDILDQCEFLRHKYPHSNAFSALFDALRPPPKS